VRLFGRRRPAGNERVPNEVLTPELVLEPLGPVVLRLGPGNGLLEYPGGRTCHQVANIWWENGGWYETVWPTDPHYGWFIAPIDLGLGHILEFRGPAGTLVGWVADATPERVIVVIAAGRERAAEEASNARESWVRKEVKSDLG